MGQRVIMTMVTRLFFTPFSPGHPSQHRIHLFKFTLNRSVPLMQHNKYVFFRLFLQRNFKKIKTFLKN